MLHKAPVLLVPLVLLCPTISHGEQSGPSNYDECIIGVSRQAGTGASLPPVASIEWRRSLLGPGPQEFSRLLTVLLRFSHDLFR
jgi:hypothetical protein